MWLTPSLLALLAPLIPLLSQAVELRQLKSDDFKQSISHGQWLVEHFSPSCGHCRAFAPTWEKLAEEKKNLEGIAGFHMAQVNCLAQGDLCQENGIKGYPTISLYQDGKAIETYTKSRSIEELSAYIDASAKEYSKRQPSSHVTTSQTTTPSTSSSSEVFSIKTGEDLEKIKSEGGFIKFFAPWCGHCKKLAPTWKQLASDLGTSMTIAEVDCEANKALCQQEGILGYPQLYLYANGQKHEHSGARSLDAMTTFAKKALTAGKVEYIDSSRLEAIAEKEEVFFIFLHAFNSPKNVLETVMSASKTLLGSAVIYQSQDLDLFNHTGVDPSSGPTLLSFKDHNPSSPVASYPFNTPSAADISSVASFLEVNKLPTVVKLDSHNFKEVMKNKNRSVVVLAAFRTKGRKEGELEKEQEKLAAVARAWRKGGRKFDQGVIFAWMDGDKWSGWLNSHYGMSRSQMPAVRVADPPLFEYYDVTLELEPIQFNGASIFSTLEGFHQHTLRPRTVEPFSDRLFRAAMIKMAGWKIWVLENLFKFILLCVGLLGAGVWLVRKLILWEFPSDHSSHLKLSNRLD